MVLTAAIALILATARSPELMLLFGGPLFLGLGLLFLSANCDFPEQSLLNILPAVLGGIGLALVACGAAVVDLANVGTGGRVVVD